MGKKNKKIYITSNVSVDYFFFLCKVLRGLGYEVKPIYLISEAKYRSSSKNLNLSKLYLRIQMYIFYPIYIFLLGLISCKSSIFIVSSNTFFAPFLMNIISKFKGNKIIHMLYDLYPDAIEASGLINPNSFLSKNIGRITSYSLKKCSGTVFLGDYLRSHAELRWGKCKQSEVIDISTDLTLFDDKITLHSSNEKIKLHYGGQLGNLHDANSLVSLVKSIYLSDLSKNVEFNFTISGSKAEFLRKALRNYPIQVSPTMKSHAWRSYIKNFDIGIVTLSPGGASVCLPSKTYAMMAGGLAILAITPEWSDLAQLIKNNQAGWVFDNSNNKDFSEIYSKNQTQYYKFTSANKEIISQIIDKLRYLIKNREYLFQIRENAFIKVRQNYNEYNLGKKWEKFIEKV